MLRTISAYLNKIITDTCCDKDGTWNALRIMRNLCFGFGLYCAMQYPALESRWTFLVLLGYGSQGMKVLTEVYQRKTADGNGNPMMQAGTETAPAAPVVVTPTTEQAKQEEAAAAEAI